MTTLDRPSVTDPDGTPRPGSSRADEPRSGSGRITSALRRLVRWDRPAPTDPGSLDRPALASSVRVHPPQEEGASWIMQAGTSRYFRISADFAAVAQLLDGLRSRAEVAEQLGPPWTVTHVDTVVQQLARGKLLDDGSPTARRRRPDRRLRYLPPLTVQFTVVDPGSSLAVFGPVVAAIRSRPGRWALGVLVASGLAALLIQAGDLYRAISTPQPLGTYVIMLAGILIGTALHEIGHGAVLTHHGGRPSRLGVMLFYLSPAFFCDVSDGWRLRRREDRVAVALAGIVVQVVLAALFALVALLWPAARPELLLLTLTTLGAAAFNTIPLIKLDGYIALMTHLDIPHLRDRAMTDGRRMLARVLFGGRYTRELPDRPWSPWYGLACMLFPVQVVFGAMLLWLGAIGRLGPIGAVLVGVAVLLVARWIVRGLWRLLAQARQAGASTVRMASVTTLLVGGTVAALVGISVPLTVTGGYTVAEDGTVVLVASGQDDPLVLTEGAPVVLQRSGLIVRERTGEAVLTSRTEQREVPLGAILPAVSLDLSVRTETLVLTEVTGRPDAAGTAVVTGPAVPLWEWAWRSYLMPALQF